VQFDAIAQFDADLNKTNWHLGKQCNAAKPCHELQTEETIAWWVQRYQETVVVPSVENESRFPRMMAVLRGFIPQITQPIFTAGRLKSRFVSPKRNSKALSLAYGKTIQTGFAEVSNTLIAHPWPGPSSNAASTPLLFCRRVWGLDYQFTMSRIWLRVSGAARLVSTPSRPFRAGLGSGSPFHKGSPTLSSSGSPVSRRALKFALKLDASSDSTTPA